MTWHLLLRAEVLGAVGVGVGGGGGAVVAGLPQARQHAVQHVQAGGTRHQGLPVHLQGARLPPCTPRPRRATSHLRICSRNDSESGTQKNVCVRERCCYPHLATEIR